MRVFPLILAFILGLFVAAKAWVVPGVEGAEGNKPGSDGKGRAKASFPERLAVWTSHKLL